MNPDALLILLLAAVGAGALLFSAAVAVFAWLARKSTATVEAEERLARYAEHMAAQNGRPHTDAVLSRATRRDP